MNEMNEKKKLIGTRIPESVIAELKEYCNSHGILINHFVSEAIKAKLDRVKRSEENIKAEKLSTN
jgi:predicted DNA binding CopG/RHH family protein